MKLPPPGCLTFLSVPNSTDVNPDGALGSQRTNTAAKAAEALGKADPLGG